jgi:sugar phosphate isomerase/epimerase
MYSNLCPETVGLRGLSPITLIDLAARHGFGGVDCPAAAMRDVDDARRLTDVLLGRGLRWGLFWMPCDFPTADDATLAAGLARLRELLPIVQAAGCTRTYNHVWPASDRPYDEQFPWTVNRLRPVAALLADYGVRYGLEFIGPRHLRESRRHPFVYRLDQAIALADAVGHGAGVVVDFFHLYTSGGTAADARALLTADGGGSRIVNVHANDAPRDRHRDDQLDGERDLPLATGVIDAPGVMSVLHELSYDGPVIVEPFEPQRGRLGAMPADDALTVVQDALGRLLR